ncbi:unnamed protein product [Cuscuta campestris]|uniref:Uncharacterized protein n=1 Tax=Cuscuta campestris TaxID=132261 RepID=A0A484KG05_9ASTE|nr:unnamed protein product [Cuscuta campestris]
MVQTRSNANVGTGVPQQGENSTTGGRNPPITTGEAEALIQRVGITAEQFKEVLAALAPNREVVVEDVAEGPTGGKAGPTGSQGKKKKDTRSARKGDLRDTLKEKRGESTATSKVGSEERRTTVGDKGAAELWKMYEQLEKRLDAQNPYRQAVFSEACEWFHKLPKGSIDKWSDLAHKFLEHFASSQRQKLPFSHLLNVKIRKGEQLREFINRWEKEARDVQGADDQALIAMLQAALPQGDVRKELRRNPLSTYQEMLAWAKYLALEEEDDEPPVRKEKKNGPPVAEGKKRKDYGKGPNPTGTHNTSECVTLRKEMDQLIARGPPPRTERPSSGNRTWRRPPAPTAAITAGEGQEDGRRHLGRDCDDLDEEERQGRRHLGCRFIMGGNTGGDSVSSRKRWKNMVYLAEVQRPPLPKRKKKEPLIFTDEDYPPVLSPHRDALVIKVEINNVVVHCTLVDTGSSVNVMYSNTFTELGLSRGDLKPIHTPLSGFTGDTIEAEGTITVKAGVRDGTHRLWVDMEFMVVQLNCAHHLILGRPGLEDLECVISPVHLCLKFNTPTGVGIVRGNQSLSRSCYVRATKSQARVDENVSTICAAIQKEEGRPRAEPVEEVEEVSLDPAEPQWKVKIEFKPRPAIKGQALADFVVECTAREVESSGEEPEGNWWTVYTDGSSATDASGGGVVAISPEGFKAYYSVRFRFKVSNNEAEYEALGLRLAASLKAERIQVRCDSKLVVGHVTGEFEAKDERMKKYRDAALELLKAFGAYRIEQVPRGENAEADILSKLGPDSPDHIKAMTQEEELLEPSISPGQVLIITLKEEPDWIDEITMYILDGSLPIDPIAAKVVKRRAPSYTLECGRLYKRSYNGTLLRVCAQMQGLSGVPEGAGATGDELHPDKHGDSLCSVGHRSGRYFSSGDREQHIPGGRDRLLHQVGRGAPVPTITAEQMTKFVSKQILCRFGVPQQIITDNGTQFEAGGFNEFLQSWGIKHSYAAVGTPKPMGRTTPRKATGETPFSLTYGFEARAPAETSLLSYRVETFDARENEENLRAELHLIDERRERAYMRAENYRRQVKSYYDQRVRPRQFKMGDWVLRKREVSRPTDGGKFAKSFEGPYRLLGHLDCRLQPVATFRGYGMPPTLSNFINRLYSNHVSFVKFNKTSFLAHIVFNSRKKRE